MIKLIIEDDEGKTTVVPLIRDEISIGRKEGNTIRLTERNVSRRHARLVKGDSSIFIEDLESYNGIKVNGSKIFGRVSVTEGDRVQIGDYVLALKLDAASKAKVATEEVPAVQDDAAKSTRRGTEAADDDAPTDVIPKRETSETARLVCVSKNFAKREFSLAKPMMVVGRTDDNDVVINHRSVSRHHCRIVEAQGRFTIVDLQSANGVRVNDEEYGKVELRRGDQIDLGHVRLRFVAPDEDFVFDRDAEIVDTTKTSAKSISWFALAMLVVFIVGCVIWMHYQYEEMRTTPPPISEAQRKPVTSVRPADQSQTISAVERAISNESWSLALEKCREAGVEIKETISNECNLAEREQRWKRVFEDAGAKATQLAYEEALVGFAQIPEESIYAQRRDQSPVYREARANFLARVARTIEEYVAEHDCESAKELSDKAISLLGGNEDLRNKAAACRRPPRRPKRVAVSAKTNVAKKKTRVRSDATLSEEDVARADQWLGQARAAYVAGRHGQAMSLARKVLDLQPRRRDATQILGASACYTGEIAQAQWAYKHLDARRRNLLRTVCTRKGVTLP